MSVFFTHTKKEKQREGKAKGTPGIPVYLTGKATLTISAEMTFCREDRKKRPDFETSFEK
jgi:hypothetical protein